MHVAEQIRNEMLVHLPVLHAAAQAKKKEFPTSHIYTEKDRRVVWIPVYIQDLEATWQAEVDLFDGRLFKVMRETEIAVPDASQPCVVQELIVLPVEYYNPPKAL